MAFALLILSACGGTKPVSDVQLREDTATYIEECDAQTGSGEYRLEAFEIVKRQTSNENGVDKVWVKTVAKANDGSMKTEIELVMNYELYNDGWHWENAETLAETVIPLVEPAYSEVDLTQCIQSSGSYPGLTDVVVYDTNVDMEQGYATYSLTCRDVHINMEKALDITVGVPFVREGYSTGAWMFNWDVVINSVSENWSWVGEYIGDFFWNHDEYKFYASGEGSTPPQFCLYRRDHYKGTGEWEEYRVGTLDWFSLSPYTKDSFLLRVIDTSEWMREYYSKGYSVKYEGMDFNAMKYAAITDDGTKKLAVVFCGPDSAYVTGNVADINRDKMEIVIECVPLQILQTLSLVEEITPNE